MRGEAKNSPSGYAFMTTVTSCPERPERARGALGQRGALTAQCPTALAYFIAALQTLKSGGAAHALSAALFKTLPISQSSGCPRIFEIRL